jgi:hypothetical protein
VIILFLIFDVKLINVAGEQWVKNLNGRCIKAGINFEKVSREFVKVTIKNSRLLFATVDILLKRTEKTFESSRKC